MAKGKHSRSTSDKEKTAHLALTVVHIPHLTLEMERESMSQLRYFKMHNFGPFADEKVEFPEGKAILHLEGYNNSGKSALLRGLDMLLFGGSKRNQVKFVRDGTDYFEIEAGFSDGVSLLMRKYSKSEGSGVYYEMWKDGERVFTTKEGRALTAVKNLPKPFVRYVDGLLTKGANFNYRGPEDNLLLTNTTAAENNASLNDVLQFTAISEAVDSLNKDINKVNSDYAVAQGKFSAIDDELTEYYGVTQRRVEDLDSLLQKGEKLTPRVTAVADLTKKSSGLGIRVADMKRSVELEQLDKDTQSVLGRLEGVETSLAATARLKEVAGLANATEDYRALDEDTSVTEVRLKSLGALTGTYKGLEELPVEGFAAKAYAELDKDANGAGKRLTALTRVFTTLSKAETPVREYAGGKEFIPLDGKAQTLLGRMSTVDKLGRAYENCRKTYTPEAEDLGKLGKVTDKLAERVQDAEKLISCSDRLQSTFKTYTELSKTVRLLQEKLDAQTEKLAEAGYSVATCPQCGATIAVEK